VLRKRTGALTASAVAVAMLLTACGGTSSASGSGGTTLTLGSLVVPSDYSADAFPWANAAPFAQAVYDTLVQEDPNGNIQPSLATSWTYNSDKTVLTLKLRTDVKFTDGTAFDAAAAVQNLNRFKNGTSPLKSYLALMTNAKAVDASTLQITLSAPNPAMLRYLAGAAGLQESPKNFGAANEKTDPIGSGPYVLDTGKTVVGSKYVYTKNANYWNKSQQHYNGLVINVYQTTPTQVNAIRGGQVNGIALLDNSAVDQVKAAGFTVSNWELNTVGIWLFDRDGKVAPALKQLKVRQAINYAIDRNAMLKAVGKGYGTTTTQVFKPTDTASFDKSLDSMYAYDPAKAKQLLAQAGYPNGFTLTMPEVQTGSTTAYDLLKQYLAAVGITVNFVNEPANNLIPDVAGAKFAAVSALPLQADPTAWMVANFKLLPTATWNPFHVQDATIASLAKTIQTGSDAAAAAAGKQLNQYVVEQAWVDPWYRPQQSFATDSKTSVVVQQDNAYPFLWNITPKS
jgi:peptide/nickel transport system substrate-binding protein